ncbi:hypothetical protein BN1708_008072 [Verticillium longisporum]|uniref:Uncharacterized protein n=1 Tax=Verticillium longisporum TaxID=100787 RepID=A0A0G4N0K1_VERLO|nr:hypothetical protein BN1708_008072 [Verticillium longisporum]
MFLHSGAAMHGHEFSNRSPSNSPSPSPSPSANAAHRLRSAFGDPPSPSPIAPFETDLPSRRQSLSAPILSPLPATRRPRPFSDIAPRKEQIVRFNEKPIIVGGQSILSLDGSVSEDESVVSDVMSDITSQSGTIRRRRRPRSSSKLATNFLLAYPPPRKVTKQRRFVQIRPRVMLQLQQLSADRRPKPTLDVLPTSVLAGSLIIPRLVQHCPKMFNVKGNLAQDDLVLAKSENYDLPEDQDEDTNAKDLDKRDLVAIISPITPRKEGERRESVDEVEIVLADGSVWMGKPWGNGSYEFVHIDESGVSKTARWVKKGVKAKRDSFGAPSPSPPPTPDSKYIFSLIDPTTRRHPIMATLTSSNLEVLDHYVTLSKPHDEDNEDEDEPPRQKMMRAMDDVARTLITVTSVWVSLRNNQNWPMRAPRPTLRTTGSTRTTSMGSDRSRASTVPMSASEVSRPSSPVSVAPPQTNSAPKRSLSTGAAYMQRRLARQGNESPPQNETPTEGDEVEDPKILAIGASAKLQKRKSICRRVRDWGHRITHSSKEKETQKRN